MNKIEKLIEELCPQGVEVRALGDVCIINAGGDLPKNYIKGQDKPTKEFPYPIYSNGTEEKALYGYTDSYKITDEAVTISARGTIGYHAVRSAKFTPIVRLITLVPSIKIITVKFLNYVLDITEIGHSGGSIPQLTVPNVKKLQIPTPPLAIQKEIDKILDNFTRLEAELEAELEARKKQYEHYREALLTFGDDVEFRALGEVLDYEQPTKYIVDSTKYNDEFSMPVLTAGQSFILGYTDESEGIYDADKQNAVIIFDDFTTAFHWVDFNFKVKSSAMKMLRPQQNTDVDFRFVYFAMRCIGYQPQDHARHWISKYSKIQIPIPPLSKQKEIVAILDKFDALVNDISTGLPAEIEARRKQYEYYRNQLLTFKPLELQDAN